MPTTKAWSFFCHKIKLICSLVPLSVVNCFKRIRLKCVSTDWLCITNKAKKILKIDFTGVLILTFCNIEAIVAEMMFITNNCKLLKLIYIIMYLYFLLNLDSINMVLEIIRNLYTSILILFPELRREKPGSRERETYLRNPIIFELTVQKMYWGNSSLKCRTQRSSFILVRPDESVFIVSVSKVQNKFNTKKKIIKLTIFLDRVLHKNK